MTTNDQANFNALVERALQQGNRGHMRPVIEKELLHGDILFALSSEGLLKDLVFQGGTSLRLCYGGNRFSEDLDFAGGVDFSSHQIAQVKECIEDYLSNRYGLEVSVKEPPSLRDDPKYSELNIDKWQVAIVTAPDRPDIPKQRIKLEVANIPAHTSTVMPLVRHYDFLPAHYDDTLIAVETLEEVMADKLVSLPATEKYVRHRDVWDLAWMAQRRVTPNADLVARKLADYQLSDYDQRLARMIEHLPQIIGSDALAQEMSRFLPSDVFDRTFGQPTFLSYLQQTLTGQLADINESLYADDSDDDRPSFSM